MITKCCIVCLSLTASAMIGLAYTKKNKSRVTYFESCVKLTEKLIADISFRRDNLCTILCEFAQNDTSDLRKQIEKFCASPYGNFTVGGGLKAAEKQRIGEFFSSLGSSDLQTQLTTLESYKAYFAEKHREENEKYKKTGNLALKLSILFGLAVGILIL